jgi:hypothetical protein
MAGEADALAGDGVPPEDGKVHTLAVAAAGVASAPLAPDALDDVVGD